MPGKKTKCPECGKEIGYVIQTWTAYESADVSVDETGLVDWGTTQTNDTDDNYLRCPECSMELDIDPTDQGVKDFFEGISREDKERMEKEKEEKEKEDKEQWQRRQMGRSAMDTPNLDYSILSKNSEKKVEPKKEMVQIVRKASLNTNTRPRLPRLIVERKKVVLSEDESF